MKYTYEINNVHKSTMLKNHMKYSYINDNTCITTSSRLPLRRYFHDKIFSHKWKHAILLLSDYLISNIFATLVKKYGWCHWSKYGHRWCQFFSKYSNEFLSSVLQKYKSKYIHIWIIHDAIVFYFLLHLQISRNFVWELQT